MDFVSFIPSNCIVIIVKARMACLLFLLNSFKLTTLKLRDGILFSTLMYLCITLCSIWYMLVKGWSYCDLGFFVCLVYGMYICMDMLLFGMHFELHSWQM